LFFVECARDLGKSAAARVLEPDSLDDSPREGRRPAGATALAGLARRLQVLAQEALQLGHRDQPRPPRRLHRVYPWHHAAVDRGNADAKRLGRLLAAVGEALGLDDLPQLTRRCPDQLRLDTVMA